MFSVLFHPEIGDTPGSALVMWLLVAGFAALIIVAMYFVIKLLRSLFKRGR